MKQLYFFILLVFLGSKINAQITYVPDDNFEQALIDLGYDSGALDDFVPTANISTVTWLDVSNKSITSLTGIEGFTNLESLFCYDNNLTSIDVSANTALITLYLSDNSSLTSLDISNNVALINLSCGSSNLTSLDVSNNTLLEYLSCDFNSLSNLDISNNVALEILQCSYNSLTSLDVSNNIELKTLNCHTNSLTYLNLVNNPQLESVYCLSNELTGINLKNGNNTIISFFSALDNPNLACIQVEDEIYSTANWSFIDPQTSFSNNCAYSGNTYIPDDNFEQALIDLGYDSGPLDDYVPTININTITTLYLQGEGIYDLSGIEDFTELRYLTIDNNSLTSLDVSNNTALKFISSNYNDLTSLDISNNPDLEFLYCKYNSLTDLDVSNNTGLYVLDLSNNDVTSLDVTSNTLLYRLYCYSNNIDRLNLPENKLLEDLDCSDNELIGINLKNGKNGDIVYFNALNNPDLECIQVDNPAYSEANWTNIDPTSSFRRNCRYRLNYSRQELTDSINEPFNNKDLSIFPNPVNDVLTISSKINGQFSIVDIKGQVLKQGALMKGNTEIDLTQFERGIYFLKLTSETDSMSKKIIKN